MERLLGWRKDSSREGGLSDCSLVVATFRRRDDMLELMENLSALPDPPGEVVVVDGSPEDDVGSALSDWAAARELPFEMLYVKSPVGLTRQRNVGVDASSGEFVFFLDDDCRPKPGYFRTIRDVFRQDGPREVGAVSGSIVNEMNLPLSWRWRLRFALGVVPRGEPGQYFPTATSLPRALERPFTGTRAMGVIPGGASAYRREVFARERFSEFFSGYAQGEDVEMSRRIARHWKLLASGDAHVVHDHATDGRPDGFQRGRMAVRNRFFIWKRHSPHPGATVRLQFWADQAYIAAYHAGYFLARPGKPASLAYALGVLYGAAECVVSPPRYEEPPAQRRYEFSFTPLEPARAVSR